MKQRELKFRAWDIEKKMFLPNDVYAIITNDFNALGVMIKDWQNYKEGEYLYSNSQTIMQFTGLTDKNGKEIYEGDVLGQDCAMIDDYTGKSSKEVQKLIVRWNGKEARWSVYCPSAMITNDWGYIPGGTYIIGNLYETPDLLTPQPNP